jgi:sn-glycerol 3-phosphate transport system ATP-binding protein
VSAEVTLGIRPEHIDIDPDGFSLPVDLVEPLGSEMLVHGRLADGSLLTVKLPSHTPVGETISVSFRVEQLHLFDRASGNRIS